MTPPAPVYKLKKKYRKMLERFGSVKNRSAYHWQIRDEDGCLLADFWPHTRKFRVEDAHATRKFWPGFHSEDEYFAALVKEIEHEFPEFETPPKEPQ